jgi:glycosyltransferase involved in cell wall biosynthesis
LLDADVTPDEVADAVAGMRDAPQVLDLRSARRVLEERFSAEVVGKRLLEIYGRITS